MGPSSDGGIIGQLWQSNRNVKVGRPAKTGPEKVEDRVETGAIVVTGATEAIVVIAVAARAGMIAAGLRARPKSTSKR